MSEVGPLPRTGERFRTALGLLDNRQRLSLVALTLERIAVGCCDLLMAAAMYLLFMLLQGRPPAHAFSWLPKSTLSAAILTAALVALRALTDVWSARSLFRYIQDLYTRFLLRLTQGYNQMRWSRYVERNRSELVGHSIYTARDAVDFYQSCVEMAAAAAIVLIMAAALIYQSPFAASLLGGALALFYAVHRLLSHRHLQLRIQPRTLAPRGPEGPDRYVPFGKGNSRLWQSFLFSRQNCAAREAAAPPAP